MVKFHLSQSVLAFSYLWDMAIAARAGYLSAQWFPTAAVADTASRWDMAWAIPPVVGKSG